MSKFLVVIDDHRFQVELPSTLTFQLCGDESTAQRHSTTRQPLTAFSVLVDGLPLEVVIPEMKDLNKTVQCLFVNSRPVETSIDPNRKWIKSSWGIHNLEVYNLDMTMAPLHNGNGWFGNGKASNGQAGKDHVQAPIPGLIVQVKVSTGDTVDAGQPLFILEAMKMENEIRAPRSGIIKSIYVSPGQAVALSQVLAEID